MTRMIGEDWIRTSEDKSIINVELIPGKCINEPPTIDTDAFYKIWLRDILYGSCTWRIKDDR